MSTAELLGMDGRGASLEPLKHDHYRLTWAEGVEYVHGKMERHPDGYEHLRLTPCTCERQHAAHFYHPDCGRCNGFDGGHPTKAVMMGGRLTNRKGP